MSEPKNRHELRAYVATKCSRAERMDARANLPSPARLMRIGRAAKRLAEIKKRGGK